MRSGPCGPKNGDRYFLQSPPCCFYRRPELAGVRERTTVMPTPYGGEYVCWKCGRRFVKPQEYRLVAWYPDKGGMNYRVECRSAYRCDGA
jgi:hypothetical protein